MNIVNFLKITSHWAARIKRATRNFLTLTLSLGLILPNLSFAQDLPTPLTSALMLKIVELEQNLSAGKQLTIMVINDPALAKTLKTRQGKAVKDSLLASVIAIEKLSEAGDNIPDILFIGRTKNTKDVIAFANKHKILTVTGDSNAVYQGMILAFYNNEGVPGILLNLPASKANGFQWQPEILNVVSVVK